MGRKLRNHSAGSSLAVCVNGEIVFASAFADYI